MKKIYICTVGTGTAGKYSNVAEGIMAAVRFAQPDFLLLLPSTSEDSVAVAQLIEEGVVNICRSEVMYLKNHDDLESCRKTIAEILYSQKKYGAVYLNPTSGTKQMTTAAVLAALDAEIENIEYITGPRKDGVIITGKEQISTLNARKFIAEKYKFQVMELIRANSAGAAVRLIKPYSDIFPETAGAAEMFYFWRRSDYNNALKSAGDFTGSEWKKSRKILAELRNAESSINLIIIIDILNYAELCIKCGDAEEALAVLYRLVEMSAKLRLKEMAIDCDNLNNFAAVTGNPSLCISQSVRTQLQAMENHRNYHLGLRLSLEILKSTDFAFCRNFLLNKKNWGILQKRNRTRYGHGFEYVKIDEINNLYNIFCSCLEDEWAESGTLRQKIKYPNLELLIENEK